MKQIKRLISLLTVAAVIIGCLGSFAAYAANGSSRVGAYDPEKRLTALGFMDEGDIDAAAEKMSRAMFVRTAVRIYMASSNIPSWGAQTFRDVTADSLGAAEIQLAANSGLIDSGELFYPDEPISYSDAEKILVRVLGYEPMAERSGYMAAATSAKVFRGVNAAFLMKDALKALDNALECPRMKGVTYGSGTRYETSDTDTLLLRAGFDKKSVTITEIDVANSSITADGVTYKTENVDLGAIPEGTAYIYIRESDDVVVFVETRGETELLYDFIEYVNDSDKHELIYGGGIDEVTLRNTEKTYKTDKDAKITFAEGEGAGDYVGAFAKIILRDGKIAKMEAYPLSEGGLIYRADDQKIKYISRTLAENIIKDFDTVTEREIYIDGVRHTDMKDIKAEYVFDYWYDEVKDKIIVVTSSRKVEGLFESYSGNDITIDGVRYELSRDKKLAVQSYLTKRYDGDTDYKTLLRHQVVAYIDDNKCIRFIKMNEKLSQLNEFYGVVTKAKQDKNSLDTSRRIEVYRLTGQKGLERYEVAKKLSADSLSFDYVVSVAADYKGNGFLKFTLNGNNEIKKIEKPEYWGFQKTTTTIGETIEAIPGLSFKKATMFALIKNDGEFTVKPLTWENIKKTRTINDVRFTMVSDFDIMHNPVPRFIAFTDNIEYLYSGYTNMQVLEEICNLPDDKVELNFAQGGKYVVTRDFAEKNKLTERCFVRYSDRRLGDDPILVHSRYDMSGDPDTWETTPYTQDASQGFFKMDSIRYRDDNVVQFETAGVPSEVYLLDEWYTVIEYNERTGKCTRRALADVKPGDKVWYYVAEWPSPKSIQVILYIKNGMTPQTAE